MYRVAYSQTIEIAHQQALPRLVTRLLMWLLIWLLVCLPISTVACR